MTTSTWELMKVGKCGCSMSLPRKVQEAENYRFSVTLGFRGATVWGHSPLFTKSFS